MCGRYANHVEKMPGWEDILGDWPGNMASSMDIAPTQTIPVVVRHNGANHSKSMYWGLVPAWSDTPKPKYATFNARAETAAQKPAFRNACAKAQSCIIPASAYYEWSGEKGHKTRHYIQLENQQPLLMAGLWEHWTRSEQSLYSCTILTRAAIPDLMAIHPRMPLILSRDTAQDWLELPIKPQLVALQKILHFPLAIDR